MDIHNNYIFRCEKHFAYTKYYISVILIAKNIDDAKNKFISKCLSEYDYIIKNIDFELFYDENEHLEKPIKFKNILYFEIWLNKNIEEDDIECLGDCHFEIIDKY